MKKFLLDTNAFFEMLSYLAGKNVRSDGYDFADILDGECFISKITELEVMSVIGKYARGDAPQWQRCFRQIGEDGAQCGHSYFHPGRRPWNKNLCKDMYKMVKEMTDGRNPLLHVRVLALSEAVLDRAELFLMHASKYKFGSQDALIAATSIVYSRQEGSIAVVTSDKGLRAAMKEEGICFVTPGSLPKGT